MARPIISLFSFLFILSLNTVSALPLYTYSRWIADENGTRVKLACVNWPSHLDTSFAEGLSKQPVDAISKLITSMGFNCVRLTWPLFLATNWMLAAVTVRQSFQSLGLDDYISGIQDNNPGLVNLSLIRALQAVVSTLGENNVMVILDNHLSKPGWCCSEIDGNGFFGDESFDPEYWIVGLTRMATLFRGVRNMVGMSLRNELRGPRQNVEDWYTYMQRGAEEVHKANPDVLVILSGLNFDTDLSFLADRPVNLPFYGKTVYEMHWYGFTDGHAWEIGNLNQVCGQVYNNVKGRSGFLLDRGLPLFVSEFGVDLRGTNVNDNRYLNCFMAAAFELDVDFALWSLAGSYYIKEGVKDVEEYFGMLNSDWSSFRNPSLTERISILQTSIKGSGLSIPTLHKIIFHPATGQCLLNSGTVGPLSLGPCSETQGWIYSSTKVLMLRGIILCIQADQLNKPAVLGSCTEPNLQWDTISDSQMHLQSKTTDGTEVCLDVGDQSIIVTNACKCLSGDSSCDPSSQWFKIVDSLINSSPSKESGKRRKENMRQLMTEATEGGS
ncbi:hypothetical protein ACFX19_021601 [Malus domestica]